MAYAQILVVEDESITAKAIQRRLTGMGYAVPAVTASGEDAIRKAATTRPDLVLMDIVLKGAMDGVEAADYIRRHFNIPVVYLTAYADEQTLERAKLSEPFGYILKPFEEKELYTTIEMALYKHRMERKLHASERWLATTLRSIGDAVITTDANGAITFMNPMAEALTGWRREEGLGRHWTVIFKIVDHTTRTLVDDPVMQTLREGVAVGLTDHLLSAKDGTETPIDDSAAPIRDDQGHPTGVVVVFRDISERRRAEEERERLILELQEALAKVKTLSGLLPICATCKKIRDDKGYWNQVEAYIQAHSEAQFTHGICPDCIKQYYSEFARD
jgi:PAS domain S-box-containing protein